MVLNTFTVGASVTPTVVKTYASHYIHRKPRAQKPTAHISYDEGLALIRQFLHYASNHTVEELQAFTAQWVPTPRWVRSKEVTIAQEHITKAADVLIAQLGHRGIDRVGGKLWWQWRRDNTPLEAEWVEMRSHYNLRKKHNEPCKRIMLYIHGGAYFFGSVDEHRYQLQRHARKLQARVLAPKYRLSPQFPFPCGLHDCLSTYLYLLTMQDPTTIILAGDSAGGGMVISLLCTLRDQGIPLPAGAVLISPWVDLTHSFPSLGGDGQFDYIPAHGFMHQPSMSWPPPNEDDMAEITKDAVKSSVEASLPRKSTQQEREGIVKAALEGFETGRQNSQSQTESGRKDSQAANIGEQIGEQSAALDQKVSVMLDGKRIVIKDQIQMYTTNQLIDHPLVSPVLQPSLGGLPPLLILTGGGELLRDEQIYLAYKAANPKKYRPSEAYLDKYPEVRDRLDKYKPTDVQLQVWADLCHVAPTLSFTRPAKFMYRSVAQFSAWALAKAQKTEIEILDDDAVSIISSGSDTQIEETETIAEEAHSATKKTVPVSVGKAGDPLPRFRNHMIEQGVDRHGNIFPLQETDAALSMVAEDIGVPKAGPLRKWLAAKQEWDTKFAKERAKVKKQRAKEIAAGYQSFGDDDVPPPSALAGRRGLSMPKEKKKRSLGLSLWSLWGSSHDKDTLEREANADKEPETSVVVTDSVGSDARPGPAPQQGSHSRSRSRRRMVSYDRQDMETDAEADPLSKKINSPAPEFTPVISLDTPSKTGDEPAGDIEPQRADFLVLPGTNVTLDSPTSKRPKADGVAFPFKLNKSLAADRDDASVLTLKSEAISLEDDAGSAQAGKVSAVAGEKRPEPERFITAQERLNP